MPAGFLAVASSPSPSLSLTDFHAWYEDEHIPLRLNRLPAFLSGARYRAAEDPDSNAGPAWLALYEIDDTRTFAHPSYTGLRAQRSAREAGVMARLSVLTRLTGADLGSYAAGDSEGGSTGLRVGNPTKCIITHYLDVVFDSGDEEEQDAHAQKWAQDFARNVGLALQAWIRVRVIRILERGQTEMGVAVDADVPPGEYSHFAVLELDNDHDRAIVSGLLHGSRMWDLYKAYPCIAQGNVDLQK